MAERTAWPYPLWIAHRGGGRCAPENTMAAFRTGQSRGFAMAECDVTLSADGIAFLLHDPTLERTTDGSGVACRLPWAELATLDAGGWFGAGFANERLPTLDALLQHAAQTGLLLNLELKPGPGDAARTGRVVARQVAAHGLAARAPLPLLSSFEFDAVAAARDVAPQLPRALLFDAVPETGIAMARSLGCIAIGAAHRRLDAAGIAAAHDAGLAVMAYTVNETADAQRLRSAGIDALFTDAINHFDPRG